MMNTNRPHDRRMIVHTLWQGDVDAPLSHVRVIDPVPVYLYRQHGHTLASREPMLRVVMTWNAGDEEGVVSAHEFMAAYRARPDTANEVRVEHTPNGVRVEHTPNGGKIVRSSRFTFVDRLALEDEFTAGVTNRPLATRRRSKGAPLAARGTTWYQPRCGQLRRRGDRFGCG